MTPCGVQKGSRLAAKEPADVHRVEAVDILRGATAPSPASRRCAAGSGSWTMMPCQRGSAFSRRSSPAALLRNVRGQPKRLRAHARLRPRPGFAAHVRHRRGVVADEDNREPRFGSAARRRSTSVALLRDSRAIASPSMIVAVMAAPYLFRKGEDLLAPRASLVSARADVTPPPSSVPYSDPARTIDAHGDGRRHRRDRHQARAGGARRAPGALSVARLHARRGRRSAADASPSSPRASPRRKR